MATGAPHVDRAAMARYFAAQPEVVVAYLFGSVARGQAGALSDVDVAVLHEEGSEPQAMTELQLKYMEGMERLADREVQVTILNRVPPLVAYRVVKEGIVLYERSRAERIEFQVRAVRNYLDVKPMLGFFNHALVSQIREVGLGRRRHGSGALEAAERLRERLEGASGREP